MAWQPSPYGDPYIAQGLSDLAKLFAPPDPRELLALSQLQAAQSEQERIKQAGTALASMFGPDAAAIAGGYGIDHLPDLLLYGRSTQPGVDARSLDPSVYAIHGNAGNTFEGLDATLSNNLAGHYVDAQGALDVQALENQGAMDRTLAAPVKLGQNEMAYLPPALASLYGDDTLMGNVSVNQNDTFYGADGTGYGGLINVGKDQTTFGPNGTTYSGPASPMSKEEVLGAIIAGLPVEQQNMLAMADVQNDVVVNPDGSYSYAPRPAAAGMAAPVPASDTVKVQGTDGPMFTTAAQAAAGGMAPVEDPRSRDEVIAEYLANNPDVLAQVVTGDIPLETIYDEATKSNVLVPRPEAAGATAPMPASETVKVQGANGPTIVPAASAAAGGMTPAPDAETPAAGPGPEGSSNEAWAWRIWLDPNATPDVLAAARSILTTPKFVQVQENGQVVTKSVTFNLPPAASAAAASLPPVPVDPSAPMAAPPAAAAAPTGGFSVEPIAGTESHAALTESQAKANMYATRMAEANDGLNALAASGFNAPTWATSQFHGQMPDIANMMIDDKSRQWFTLTEQFLNPILRGDSGAAVPEAEYPRYYAQFIPKAGDDAGTLALKTRARALAVEAMRIAAGGTYGSTQERDRAVAAAALEAGLRVGDLSTDGGPPVAPTAAPGPSGALTVESVMQMSVEELQALGASDISQIPPDVLQAAAQRWDQLHGGQ